MTEKKEPIIDSLCYVPTEEVLVDLLVSLPPQMAPYLRDIFGPRVAPLFGITANELYSMKVSLSPDELRKEMITNYGDKIQKLTMTVEEFVAHLNKIGVEKAIIFNLDEETPSGIAGLPNDYYADLVNQYPDKFVGFAGIDPLKGMDAVREIRRSYDLGLRGVAVRPFMFRIPPTHAKMYPIYSTCVELGIPIWFHLSINFSTHSMEVERPINLDIVAQDFPELKMIAGHGGWPWVNEMVAVAWRNKNVYIDIASYLPKYLGMKGSGWEPLMNLGNSKLQDQILFGSTWLFMGTGIKKLAKGVMKLPLKEEVKRKWLYHNAKKLIEGL
ncbi:MAG: amidohydrolase family protein [Candidatus Lokiarchaeota archaeon]|nr:amidohydrolase family protein [Candidatus Lokiarchaeota archaeon]MBD3342882.1 amidohydrolase family protein [Candidatus Lokiarchaeota archaeon]